MRKNAVRDLEIYVCRSWGEPEKVLAERHKLSRARISNIMREQKFRACMVYPRCAVCGHSGSMHANADWQYNRGPCLEYQCECPAMQTWHD